MIIRLDSGLPLTAADRRELGECASYYGWNVDCVQDVDDDDVLVAYAYLWTDRMNETLVVEKRIDGWRGYALIGEKSMEVHDETVGALFSRVFCRYAA